MQTVFSGLQTIVLLQSLCKPSARCCYTQWPLPETAYAAQVTSEQRAPGPTNLSLVRALFFRRSSQHLHPHTPRPLPTHPVSPCPHHATPSLPPYLQSNRWEPVDGYAVDMSGFGASEHGDGDDDTNNAGKDPAKSLSDPGTAILRGGRQAASPPPPSLVTGEGSAAAAGGGSRGSWGGGGGAEDGMRNERAGSLNSSRSLLVRERR